jgi:hypothetical protein
LEKSPYKQGSKEIRSSPTIETHEVNRCLLFVKKASANENGENKNKESMKRNK